MNKVVQASTSVNFDEEERTQEFQLAWRSGEKTKRGIVLYLTPVVDANTGCSSGSLTGGATFDEEDEPEYIQWEGTRYGLAEGNVNVRASVFKVFDGSAGRLTVDMDKLEITSDQSFIGIVKIDKDNQSKKYLWRPSNIDEESSAVVWAYYESTDPDTKKVTKVSAITQVEWPAESDNYPISLSVGRQDNKEGCVYVYQTPNSSAVERGTDIGYLNDSGVVNNKQKDIYTVWQGNSISLPDGCISCSISVYKTYNESSGGITVDLSEGIATSVNDWDGIVKITTITESRKLKWIPPDLELRTQAVVHAYCKGAVSMVNVEWIPNSKDYDIRIELGQKGSKEGSDVPLKEIKLRMYPALDEITIGCTAGSVRRGQKIIENKTQYLEFQLVPLPEVSGTNDIAWEPDDPIDSSDVSKVSLGKGLLTVLLEPLDCFDRFGVSVEPTVYYDLDSGNAVGDSSFYGLVKATYQEEYQELIYQQAYEISESGILSIQTGYVYGRLGEKAAFCEIPWDTNLPNDHKELYWVLSYYVRTNLGTFEYPDNWLKELEMETADVKLDLDRKTYQDWETLLESRVDGIFAKDTSITVPPNNCTIEQRVHRTASFDFLGTLYVDNAQPIYGAYFKPYTDVKPAPNSSYKPKYFLKFAEEPEVYDGQDEFGEEDYTTTPEFVGQGTLYIPNDGSTEELKKAWKGAYSRFNKDKLHQKLLKEFPGLIRIPDTLKEK